MTIFPTDPSLDFVCTDTGTATAVFINHRNRTLNGMEDPEILINHQNAQIGVDTILSVNQRIERSERDLYRSQLALEPIMRSKYVGKFSANISKNRTTGKLVVRTTAENDLNLYLQSPFYVGTLPIKYEVKVRPTLPDGVNLGNQSSVVVDGPVHNVWIDENSQQGGAIVCVLAGKNETLKLHKMGTYLVRNAPYTLNLDNVIIERNPPIPSDLLPEEEPGWYLAAETSRMLAMPGVSNNTTKFRFTPGQNFVFEIINPSVKLNLNEGDYNPGTHWFTNQIELANTP